MVRETNITSDGEKIVYKGKIDISFPWDLPEVISGPAVIFDVVAASHNIVQLLGKVDELFVVTKDNVHFALQENPEGLLVGESDDLSLKDKFISTNSPLDVAKTDVKGKKVILITYNGTHTLNEVWSKGASPVIVATYANLITAVKWLLENHLTAKSISLVPAGGREEIYRTNPNLLEDMLCAKAAEELLRGRTPTLKQDFEKAREFIDQHYHQDWPTKEDELTLVFAESELFPVVPLCEKLPNGLLKVVPAII